MFKKLRNQLLAVNIVLIAALILGSFSVIYIVTARNVNKDVSIRLEREMERAVPKGKMNDKQPHELNNDSYRRENGQPSEDGDNEPPDEPLSDNEPPSGNGENGLPSDNEPLSGNGDNTPPDDLPPDIESAPEAELSFAVHADSEGNVMDVDLFFYLSEDFYTEKVPEIIASQNEEGTVKNNGKYWKYQYAETDEGYTVVFTDITVEHGILRNLVLILLLVGLAAIVLVLLIGLYSATRSIKPIEESYNKQKQFVADASHELKTPLTTINTNIDVLLSHGESIINDEKKWLLYIKSEAERMTKLTNDLLYLARIDHDENNVIFERVSFSDAIENVILTMEAVVFEKNIKLYYDITPEIYVYSASEQLKQLVMILLDNAIKYTPPQGDITIKLVREQKSSNAVLTVKNTGKGIDSEDMKQIFERFYRADKSRARDSGGYGLGLAIAKAITEASKGSISVDSKKDEYTQFTVKLPIAK
ncbi:MAG: GHKL domain-containing protein [Oscillospiraceae bacterium]|nr:GHKL domain-containing protein [Oscillospiraceae bacterium]